MWINMRGAKGGTRGELNEAEFVAQPPSAVVARRRERATAGVVAEMLERRQLLSTVDPSTVYWSSINPQLLALTIQAEQADPRYAMLFNADLAALGVEPPGVWVSQHPQRQSVASSALARAPAHPKTPAHGPASHKPKVHKPKAHKPKFHKPAVHSPHSAIGNPQSALGNSPHSVLSTRPSVPRGSVLSTQSPVLPSLPRPTGGFLGTIHFRPFLSTPPTVTSVGFVYDIASLPQQVVFTFNEDVASSSWSSAVTITNLSTGNALTPSSINYSNSGGTYKLTINLATGASIPDGNYVATLNGSLIYDSTNSSNKLTGSDGIQGDPYNYSFFLLAGDCNHDGIVNNSDYFTLNHNYGQNVGETWSKGDFNYDGGVGADDYALQQHNYGENLSLTVPTGVQVVDTTQNQVTLSWTTVNGPNVTGYDVVRNGTYLTAISGVSDNTYIDTGLAAGSTFTYAIESTNSAGQWSPPSHPGAVAVTEVMPTLSLSADSPLQVGETLIQAGSFTDPEGDVPLQWNLSWGDSGSGTYSGYADSVIDLNDSVGGPQDATHTYNAPGTYTISGSAVDPDGTFAAGTATIAIVAPTPTFSVSAPANFLDNQAYGVTPTFSDSAGDLPSTYTLAWGDGTASSTYTGSTTTFTHTYTSGLNAPYTLTATAIDAYGTYTNEASTDITPPTVSISGPSSVTEGSPIVLTGTFSDPSGNPVTGWNVDFGDGSPPSNYTTGTSFTHTYTEVPPGGGTYDVAAYATDADGTFYAPEATVQVNEATPSVSVTAGAFVVEGTDFTITEGFSDPAGDVPYGWSIAWGDGTNSFEQGAAPNFDHTYAEAGTYVISGTATDEDGSYSAAATAHVSEGTSTLSLANGATLPEGPVVTINPSFSDSGSRDTPTAYTIAWGDGNTSTFGTNPDYQGTFTHAYTEPGTYTISATATTDDGSYGAIATQSITETTPTFGLTNPGAIGGGQNYLLEPYFSDPGGDTVSTYSVSWGDGTTGTYAGSASTLTHQYSYSSLGPFNYYPTVAASTEDGTYTQQSGVGMYPPGGHGAFSLSWPATVNEGQAFTLTASLTDSIQNASVKGVATWFIVWGDGSEDNGYAGTTSTLSFPTHMYSEAGTYVPWVYGIYPEPVGSNESYYVAGYVPANGISVALPTPTVSLSGATSLTVGSKQILTPIFTDPGDADTPLGWQISWGDGAPPQVFSGPVGTLTHIYTTAPAGTSTDTISATAYTDDGSYTGTMPVTLTNATTVSISDANGVAYESGRQPDYWSVSRSGGSTAQALGVSFTIGGNEDAGEYVLSDASTGKVLSNGITIPANQSVATIEVTPVEDHVPEWTDIITGTLSNSSAYALGTTTTVSTEIVNDDLGITLGNGSGNMILQGSSTGQMNLVPLYLSIPSDIKQGATVTLTDSQPGEADVWTSQNPGAGAQPILGMVNGVSTPSITWTYGVSTLPTGPLWVGGTGGSPTMGDLLFTIADSDSTANSPPQHPTTNSATTRPATVLALKIYVNNDPNSGKALEDVTGNDKTPTPWLVGQLADLTVGEFGPLLITQHATVKWQIPGNVLHAVTEDAKSRTASALSADNKDGTGTSKGRVKFFWISTAAAPPGPDTNLVTVSVTGPDQKARTAATTFSLYSPTDDAAQNWQQGSAGMWTDTNGDSWIGLGPNIKANPPMLYGITWNASVSTPQPPGGAVFKHGGFHYLQVVKASTASAKAVNGVWFSARFANNWALDSQDPYPPGKDKTGKEVTPFNDPNVPEAWITDQGRGFAADSPKTLLNQPGLTDITRSDEFNLNVMYIPPGVYSQWVPLEMQDYSYLVSAQMRGGAWTVTNNWQVVNQFARQTAEPTWSQVATGASYWK